MTDSSSSLLQWLPLITAAIGAFLGALGAFWVSQLNERVKRNRKRWAEHQNALVQLEYLLNEILGITADNRYIATDAVSSISSQEKTLPIIWSEPRSLPDVFSLLTTFLRLELINDLFSYNVKIRKLNDDTKTICRSYCEMRSALIRQDIEREQYINSLKEFQKGLRILINAYNLMDKRTEELLARTRASLQRDKSHDKSFFYRMPKCEEITAVEIDSQRKRLQMEMAEIQSRSRSEIEQYLGKTPL